MKRIAVSQWNKEGIAQGLANGEYSRLAVRKIGFGVATHTLVPPDDIDALSMYCAVVAFFATIDGRIGDTYVFTQ